MYKKIPFFAAALAVVAHFATTPAAANTSDQISQIARAHGCTMPVQKSCQGTGAVAGVENAVDQDLFNGDVAQLQALIPASTQ